ncbi:MAG TPA: hypothetical protein ENJ09_11640 [Planctomycetes bacterium]|nr:hypothetical protein [Planctomycetota bacterium]
MTGFARRIPALLSLVLLFGGCASTPSAPRPKWQEVEVHAPSDRVLWKLTLLQVERLGFPLTSGLDPSAGEILTGWRTNLMPFRGQGDRRRLEVRLDAIEPGLWRVRAHVQRQRNMSLTSPLDPRRAEWEWAGDVDSEASIFLNHVLTALDPIQAPSR